MKEFPYPQSPTPQDVIDETQCIRRMIFFTPPLMIATLIIIGLLTAICIANNFNPMNWLE